MHYEEIVEKLSKDGHSPLELADYRMKLAGLYAWNNGQLSEILLRKPAKWNELRREQKSDTACERVFQATPDGLEEVRLRLQQKSIERLMSALKTRLDLVQGEALGTY